MLIKRILWLVTLALAPALAIQGYNEYALRAARETSVRADTLRVAQGAADDLAELGDSLRQVLDLVAQQPAVRAKQPTGCTTALKDANGSLPGIAILVLADVDGTVICNSRGGAPGAFSNADRPFHKRALATGGLIVGDYVEGLASGQRTVHLAQPMRDAAGTIVGVVAAAVDLGWLSQRLTRGGLAPDTAFSVLDSQGRVLVRVPDTAAWIGKQINPDRLATIAANVGRARDTTAWDGRRSIVAIAKAAGFMSTLTVSVGRDRSALFADIDAATWRGAVLILLGAALAYAAALVGSRAFIRNPVDRLLVAARTWRRGDLSARTGLAGQSEFGQLGEAFDSMATTLQGHESDLRAEIARSRVLQEQQTTMLHELNHRVKNTLATVQSLARQSRTDAHGAESLERRILALSKTHDLLTRDEWTGASLREVLENELGPYRNSVDHFSLVGPDLDLSPRQVLALGMTIHELTTNAAKYGALSTREGRVHVSWAVSGREAPRLQLIWQETGGPPVAEPVRRGFGTRLIAGGVQRELDGDVSLAYEVTGLRCQIDVPLEQPGRRMLLPTLSRTH